ncbi:TSSK1-like protein [Mya arenaria]|uniref:TSSK1-like protein n=1 Tax=Mya arenaria TaxID=6604 RepID=A0ABY7DCR2_MYAAR|nr:testis-specific serine/threonine-protein kinase 1-like [Mya arenaria]WAQ95457.1 TSSK1-like protein [Mya arenaria]
MEKTTQRKFIRMADILTSKGYRIGQEIGEGTYSKVRTVEKTSDGNTYAVKIVDRAKVRKDYLKKFMPRELEIIPLLKHENVINTFEIIQTRDFVFQVMEYAEKGDVLQLIHRQGFLPEEKCKNIFRDISKGIKYMHDLNIAHRDLKCENILIFHDNRAAVSDFGFSRAFDSTSNVITCQTFCGSSAYASPELLRGIPYDPKLNDAWSLGIILFTMLNGSMPFPDGNVTRMVQKQLSRDYQFSERLQDKVSAGPRQTVFRTLDPNINSRPTCADILEMDWLKT